MEPQYIDEPNTDKLEEAAAILERYMFGLEAAHIRQAIKEIKRLRFALVTANAKRNSII